MIRFIIILILGFFLFGCAKDSITDSPNKQAFNQTAFLRSDIDTLIPTILGSQRTNPYTVNNMTYSWNSVYVGTITSLPATHLFVKFSPQDLNEMELIRQTGEMLYDFPLDYEVVQMGDYYPQTGLGPLDIPEYFAVVGPEFQSPISGYTILSELVIPRYDSYLTAEAFRRTGNNYTRYKVQPNGSIVETAIPEGCQPGSAGYPECLLGDGTIPGSGARPIPCEPGSPIWPNCWSTTTPDYGDPQPLFNECGCEVPLNKRHPSGCVQVEDTELGMQGVRRVKVIVKDTWFTEDETWTNDLGCFEISKEYAGEVWTWIKFENNRCHIRGTAKGMQAAVDWALVIKDYAGKKGAPPYNNMEIKYYMWDNPGWNAQIFWGAATVNNALHEFYDYAAQDGITSPPQDLDIYIGRNNANGYALMSVQNQLSNSAGAVLGLTTFFTGPFAPLIGLIGWGATLAYLPDIQIGINFNNSDRLKSLSYHEIAHASHFVQVGPMYWELLVMAEIFANGHGDQNSNNAGLISVCESWADYIGGHIYVDRTYGGNNSIPDDWIILLEETWNETSNHIPVGLYNDLEDDGQELISCNQIGAGCTLVNDAVSGFTNAQMFSCLTPFVFTVTDYHNCIIANHLGSTGNTVSQVNDLFDSY